MTQTSPGSNTSLGTSGTAKRVYTLYMQASNLDKAKYVGWFGCWNERRIKYYINETLNYWSKYPTQIPNMLLNSLTCRNACPPETIAEMYTSCIAPWSKPSCVGAVIFDSFTVCICWAFGRRISLLPLLSICVLKMRLPDDEDVVWGKFTCSRVSSYKDGYTLNIGTDVYCNSWYR